MLPRKSTRYEPKTSRLRTILERCKNPSDETTNLSTCNENTQLLNNNHISHRDVFMGDGFPMNSVEDMIKEVKRSSLSSNIFPGFNEYVTTPSETSEYLSDVLQEALPNTVVEDTFDLRCDEGLTSSNSSPNNSNQDYSSDDSVRDKNYVPESSSSEESDNEVTTIVNEKKKKKESNAYVFETKNIIERRNSIERENITNNHALNKTSLSLRKRRNTIDLGKLTTVNRCVEETNNPGISEPKRKKYDTSLCERNEQKIKEKRLQYQVKPGCGSKCRKRCTSLLTNEERHHVNARYWNLAWNERRLFIKLNVPVYIPKKQKNGQFFRAPRRTFFLEKDDGTKVEVCKSFFLTTLGFTKTNDKVLYNSISDDDVIDSRGKHTKTIAYDREKLKQHIESFHPLEPHYRREHAPNRRYLPTDVNITLMHNDFREKHPEMPLSYEVYRQYVKEMNISFTQLGNEECETCETYLHHKKETSHDVQGNIPEGCETCTTYAMHHEKYVAARKLYDDHKSKQDLDNIYFSADLQKVIMLPRLDTFKNIIFCLRLTTYNQTFAPVGKITASLKPFAVLWHDALAGRKQEDIMSAFFAFLLQYRDVKHINIWLDNCSAQNKNWLLYFMLVHMVNSDYTGTETVNLYYFEPGHTFMSCDQFHHQVELAMKKKGKIYDFSDFSESVASANKGKVTVKFMFVEDFINVPNCVSDRRIQNSSPRVYLNNISQACFTRGCYDLSYKTDFKNDFQRLRFLNEKYLKNPNAVTFPKRVNPKGTDIKRKQEILKKCSGLIPSHKLKFWRDLPESK